jgi:O-antigen ligase
MVIASTLASWYGLAGFGRGLQIATGLLMIASLMTALLVPSVGLHHASDFWEPVHAGRWRGIFMHKNLLGGVSVISIIFGLRRVRNETRLWRVFFSVTRIGSFTCWIMAGSAGALGSALIALTFFLLMKNRATANPIVFVAMILIGAALAEGLTLNVGQIAGALGRDATFSGRSEVWALGRSMIQSHLLFGAGLGSDGAIFGAMAQRNLFSSAVDLHSGYLDVLFNLGSVGAFLLSLAVGAAMLRGYVYIQTHSEVDREQTIIFMTLVVAACGLATSEIGPFSALGDGAIGLWTGLPALCQLGSTSRKQKLRPTRVYVQRNKSRYQTRLQS